MSKKEKEKNLTPMEVIDKRKKYLINKGYFFDLIRKILLIFIIFYLLFSYIFGIAIMKNNDMFPRINPTDLIFYYRLDKSYQAGDVVVYNIDGEKSISRLVAIGGDEIDIGENGLIINGSVQSETDIFYNTGIYEDGIDFPIKLKEGEVFLLGDRRIGAKDSRYFGPLKLDDLEGKVFVLLRRTDF